MNLITDQWIPARCQDGTICRIAPWEIGAARNPVVEIAASRPDFRGALYQFLIGLVQTVYAPEDDDEWEEGWNKMPSCETLKSEFAKYAEAFELYSDDGPAFMQEMLLLESKNLSPISALLIDAPGDKTVKDNKDHFVKRDAVVGLCDSCVAMALMTLQTNAPSGGQGHRTGMRGGGPLTTLVVPATTKEGVWYLIWSNILTKEERFSVNIGHPVPEIFPWMGQTRKSAQGEETFPEQVNELQMYWGMPRRIRLSPKNELGNCSTCGEEKELWQSYCTLNYGVNYSDTWSHSLSPYRRQENDGKTSLLAIKGKKGGLAYSDWLSLTFGNDFSETPAEVVRSFVEKKHYSITDVTQRRLWCFGYDMDNMKARCWYDQTMPLIVLSVKKREAFVNNIVKMIAAADDASKKLTAYIKAAWFESPKNAKGDLSFVTSAFWDDTEAAFFVALERLRETTETDSDCTSILKEWRDTIVESSERLFDRFVLQDTDEIKNVKRIAKAAKLLSVSLKKSKAIKELQ